MKKILSRNIKKGDVVICINNIGHKTLHLNQEYVVDEYFREYGREHIRVIGYLHVFADRFLSKNELNICIEFIKYILYANFVFTRS